MLYPLPNLFFNGLFKNSIQVNYMTKKFKFVNISDSGDNGEKELALSVCMLFFFLFLFNY